MATHVCILLVWVCCGQIKWEVDIFKWGNKMDTERKEIRHFIKQSLRDNFERILYDAKMTDEESEVVRMVVVQKASVVKTAMALNISESTVYRIMRDFYDRTQALLLKNC